MKKVLLTTMCLFAMLATGTCLKAQEVSITLIPGWTWISNPSTDTLDFATALGSFTPMAGDVIKSQWGSAIYRNGQWKGTASQFYPGCGYHYKSNRQMPVTLTFNAQQPAPQVVVTTSEPMLITAISAMGGGEVTVNDGTYIIVKGLCWATHENPTTNDDFYQESGSGEGSFSISITNLSIGTTYYVRACAVTPFGTIYGDQKTFTTRNGIPEVSTDSVTKIFATSVTCFGTVTDNGGLNITARGVCWGTTSNPNLSGSHTTDGIGTGSFSSTLTDLAPNTTYYVRAYASTSQGTAYGLEVSITTQNSSVGQYVDLGLPSGLQWATCNVGAEVPENYGDFFSWGETQPKSGWNLYCDLNYMYYYIENYGGWEGTEEIVTILKYCTDLDYGITDNLTVLLPEDDAATVNWGADWRIPTIEEWQELFENTTSTWTTQNGVRGRLFTATNGNSIFLPAAGYRDDYCYDGGASNLIDNCGGYWSSSLHTENPFKAWGGYFNSGNFAIGSYYRETGRSVRAVCSLPQGNVPTGAIDGLFSVSTTQHVFFSKGNLQRRYDDEGGWDTWRFAEHQYDYEGIYNRNIDIGYGGWIDLFGWGTGNNPYNSSTNNGNYSSFSDWGNNPIINGGNTANQWRTLTLQEWDYVFNTRATTSGIRYAKAKVNEVNGVILLPDDWSSSTYSLNNTNSSSANYSSNVISAAQWYALEHEGAVFLPAAGGRNGTNTYNVGTLGYYWSSTYDGNNNNNAYFVLFNNVSLVTDYSDYRCRGRSVRLVRDSE